MGDKYELYDSSNPAHQTTGKRSSMKVAINFFVLPEGEMKIIEGSAQWFRDLLTVRDKYGLENWSFEVKRHGEPKDPKTKYTNGGSPKRVSRRHPSDCERAEQKCSNCSQRVC